MARISVEQHALSDPRFFILGSLMGADPAFAHDVGLARAVRLWNECIERETKVLQGTIAQAIAQHKDGAAWFVEADLAEWADEAETVFRVKGSDGRVEYLGKLREAKVRAGKARAAGAARDPKTGTFTSTPQHDTSTTPPEPSALTPTLTPALDIKKPEKSARSRAERDPAPPAAVVSIPCKSGREYHVTEDQLARWTATYQHIDVRDTLGKIAAWAAEKLKWTARGCPQGIVRWLKNDDDDAAKRERNSGGGQSNALPEYVPKDRHMGNRPAMTHEECVETHEDFRREAEAVAQAKRGAT